MDYLSLPYDPTIFEKDYRYLKGSHISDILAYISKKYSKNKDYITPLVENTTMDFIRNSANIYKKGVNYTDWDESEWVERRISSLAELEAYKKLNRQAMQWTYIIDGEAYFKALQASMYIVLYGDDGKKQSVIVKTGEFLKSTGASSSDKWFYFSQWIDGKVYECTAQDWQSLPILTGQQEVNAKGYSEGTTRRNTDWKEIADYNILPFTLIGKDIAMPQLSVIPEYENVVSAGTAYGEIVAERNFANMIYGQNNMSEADWAKIIKGFGMMEYPNIPPSEGGNNEQALSSLNLGDGKTQQEWTDIITKGLSRLAHSLGANVNGLYGEVKIESGASRRLQMENIIDVRNETIVDFREFERRDQELLIALGVVNETSEVIYNDLDMGLTELDKETAEEKRQFNINNRYEKGTITKIQQIAEIENITEEEARARQAEILNERAGGVDGENSEIGQTTEEETE
jgi:hypothetical protein